MLAFLPLLAAAAAMPAPASALRFFEGRTHGEGTLRKMFAAPRQVHVEGRGRIESDGSLTLDQSVAIPGEPVKHRRWRIREIAPGRYAGTLSDASSPIDGAMAGNVATLHYRIKGALDVTLRMTLAPDGRSAKNAMTVTKFGMTVARLQETVVKAEP